MFIDKGFFNLKNNIILLGSLYVIFSVIVIFQGSAVLLSAFILNDYAIADDEELTEDNFDFTDEQTYNFEILESIGISMLIIGFAILIENIFLLCGVFLKRVGFITFWIVLRITLLCIFLGTLSLVILMGVIECDQHYAKMIVFYCFCVGFAVFEISTVNVYRKQLSYENSLDNKMCSIHVIKV